MLVRGEDGTELKLVAHEGGWRLPDGEESVLVITDIRVGYGWMKLPTPLWLEPGETLTFYM
jgi:hypothetical protein